MALTPELSNNIQGYENIVCKISETDQGEKFVALCLDDERLRHWMTQPAVLADAIKVNTKFRFDVDSLLFLPINQQLSLETGKVVIDWEFSSFNNLVSIFVPVTQFEKIRNKRIDDLIR